MTRLIPLACLPLLAACAATENYPSLDIRPAERVTGTLTPTAPAAPIAPTPPEVGDRIDRLAATAAAAHQAFVAAEPEARRIAAAARGDGTGERWARAQVAVAGLEAARSQAMIALADLDRLYVDAATEGNEFERIGMARDAVMASVEAENATISALLGLLEG